MLQLLVNIAAVLGLILAVLSLVWQMWTYRDQKREKVRLAVGGYASVDLPDPGAALGVDVVNVGSAMLYVASVELVFADEAGKPFEHAFLEPHPAPDGDTRFVSCRRITLHSETPIEPGNMRHYVLDDYISMRRALHTPEDRVWVSAQTHLGEVARIGGATLREQLRFVVEYVERVDATAKQKDR